MTIASSTDIFFDQLKDLRSASEQVANTLPDLLDWASNAGLQEALAAFKERQQDSLRAVLSIFAAASREPGDDVCKAIAGLIEGGNSHIEMAADPLVRDHLLVAHNLRIGHYLVAAAGFTLGMAKRCGFSNEADKLAGILESEESFVRTMERIGGSLGIELGGEA